MARQVHTGEVIRLALLAGDNAAIRDREFVDCHINGPAVMLGEAEFDGPKFDQDPTAIIWELTQERAVGAVHVVNCRFLDCRFRHIGIAATPNVAARLRKELGI